MGIRSFFKYKLKDLVGRFIIKPAVKEDQLSVRYVTNGLLLCKWSINKGTRVDLLNNPDLMLCVRIYDITNAYGRDKSTCVMKEIVVKKRDNECYLNAPVNKCLPLIKVIIKYNRV